MSKEHFHSNETLECCDVSVSQQGNITVDPKKYNADAMGRLGVPAKAVRGRVRVEDGLFRFDPYGEATRNAVRRFQKNNGLTVDGRVGSDTAALILPDGTRAVLTVCTATSSNAKAEAIMARIGKAFYDHLAGL